MTNPQSTSVLVLPILKHCDGVRLEAAVQGLLSKALTVTITHHTDDAIRALVKNGDKKAAYSVAITDAGGTCNCPDFTYRGPAAADVPADRRITSCKHLIALAFAVSHTAHRGPAPRIHHLAWSDGTTVCGDRTGPYVWVYPTWRATMLDWPECCKACADIYRGGWKFHQQLVKEAANAA
jgi:hypothetical protein